MMTQGQHRGDLTLRVDARVWRRLRDFHLCPGKREESLSYVWARCERVRGGQVVLVPGDAPVYQLGPDCYERQSGGNVRLHPDVLNGMLVEFARSEFNCLVNVHDHWFADDAQFSGVDDDDDLRFDRYLRQRFEPMLARRPEIGPARAIYNLSIVLAQRGCAARLTDVRRRVPFAPARRVCLLDERAMTAHVSVGGRRVAPRSAEPGSLAQDRVARHAGFIAPDHQAALGAMHLAVVGCGGLGSIMAESLARVGVGQLTLIDGDVLEATNLNRWQGGRPADIGEPKASLLAQRLREMVPHLRVKAVTRPLEHSRSILALTAADAIVAGVDNDAARFILNHVSLQFLLPYFDVGVAISINPEVEFKGRYFAVIPGVTGCVECKAFQLVDRNEVIRAFANPAVLAERRAAGYVIDQPDLPTPSAYVLNQRTAALAVQELLNYVTGWRSTATFAGESWSTGTLMRADRDNYPDAPAECCPACSLRLGRGTSIPLPSVRSAAGVARATFADMGGQPLDA